MRQFHSMRSKFLDQEKENELISVPRPIIRTYDSAFFDRIKEELNVSILIGNFHIQLTTYERYFRLDSRIPNVSILCASPIRNEDVKSEIVGIYTFDNSCF
jgi:hypothetical protein